MTGSLPSAVFEEHRRVLLGLAYRLLGSVWDAEDVVQDAYLRWMGADRTDVRDPRGFLMTIVTRLALDHLRSARVTRTAYVGPWLPEPVATDALGPLDTAELRDTVSFATVHLMERLSPPERAVFVLRAAFELPYDEIAETVGLSAAACRQTFHRAHAHLSGGHHRFPATSEEHARLLEGFLHAARDGDLNSLSAMFAEDVTSWTDGGGLVRQARRPILGPRKVAAFWAGLFRRYEIGPTTVVDVNGHVGVRMKIGRQEQLLALDVQAGRIRQIFSVLNPVKLDALGERTLRP
ncbi:RNA polymerase sigma factor SigJ [Pseudonocardia charpentierae]|uniref:RNA polymerase sigma factor SigJ n=1 Tax=Pseudonocardia charpentierae TaxID=3075545 RepID=A0ABU2N830_9PSEU|nr:RNA polymerase sigma factor SigJ [Pseudonocardia sp. DSM 45834]MDT0350096.1 RNA polymerase sigma factor SigJ [Pseudonocardia sp. DSM 45834]